MPEYAGQRQIPCHSTRNGDITADGRRIGPAAQGICFGWVGADERKNRALTRDELLLNLARAGI